jgi:hypothetical protein
MKLSGIIGESFYVTNQLLIRFFALVRYLGGGGVARECNETVHQLFTDFRKAYNLVRREVF